MTHVEIVFWGFAVFQVLMLWLAQVRDNRAFARQKRRDDEDDAKRAAWREEVRRHRQWSDERLAELRADYLRATGQQLPDRLDKRRAPN